MNAEQRELLAGSLGRTIVSAQPVSGGDINAAFLVKLDDGERVFVKTHRGDASDDRFVSEAVGLRALRDAAGEIGIGVPRVVASAREYLALKPVEFGATPSDFEEKLGRGLAGLHQKGKGQTFGFESDNFLGRLPQNNSQAESWIDFWRGQRLLPLLDALPSEPDVQRLGHQLADRLDRVLDAPDERPTLIHGDLWSGNAGVDRDGRVWVYDPACYFAHREAEFGMTRLFGFGRRFEAAYHEAYPRADGWERRVEVYRLHHLLSHLWHFGGSYRGSCLALLQELNR